MSEFLSKPTILLVDDTPENIDVLAGILESDYSLRIALDGHKALQIAASCKPDLILLDIMMPDLDGYEVCRRLKASPQTAEIPVIFVTAKNEVSDETKGFELGAVDYLSKPISPRIVQARVRTQLALRHSQQRLQDVTEQLSRYLSPQLSLSIFEGRSRAKIETTRKKLTIFFSDIVGFTAHTEGMEPEDMSMVLNEYLNRMANIATQHGGTVDKFVGDAVLIFFGDPETQGVRQDAIAAVRMALDMKIATTELNDAWRKRGISFPLAVRTGISTGFCTVGNFGSEQRMDYTIIGGQVNVASRLEQAARPGEILLSQETWSLVQEEFVGRPMEPLQAKGLKEPIPTWQVIEAGTSTTHSDILREDRPGFHLELDPRDLDAEAKRDIIARLQAGISRLV